MSNLLDHAERELALAGMGANSTEENKLMHDNIISVVKMFSEQGHSGFSANYAIGVLTKLLHYEPLKPLMGTNDEWMDVTDVMDRKCWQNIRCGRVIKEADGTCYDIEGRVFTTPDGDSYTNRNSWVKITFPYRPKTEFVKVDKNGGPL